MLAHLTPIIRSGIIDNTRRGVTELELWSVRGESLHLQLEGDCLRDIAGCRVSFHTRRPRPAPSEEKERPLCRLMEDMGKEGARVEMGDITLSRRAPSAREPGMVANLLSIELFLNTEIRLLIEEEEFTYELSLPEWECTQACESARRMLNMATLREHVLANAAKYRGPAITHVGKGMPPCRWDAVLNRAEAYMAMAPSIHDKYALEPRGLLAEAYVLDRPDLLGEMAEDEERGEPYDPTAYGSRWDILDFVPAEAEKTISRAMEHPLFSATVHLSAIMQKHIIADMERYRQNEEVEELLGRFAGIISHVLSTIILAQEGTQQELAIARAEIITTHMRALRRRHKSLAPEAAAPFKEGATRLLYELHSFVYTLRS